MKVHCHYRYAKRKPLKFLAQTAPAKYQHEHIQTFHGLVALAPSSKTNEKKRSVYLLMLTWGINARNHDASIAVVRDNQILFAAHSERYSRVKNDPELCDDLVRDALSWGEPDNVIWAEKPLVKMTRQLYSGEPIQAHPSSYLKSWLPNKPHIAYMRHHRCHAAAGWATSRFDEAAVVVIDAVGEWDTISIWHGTPEYLLFKERVRYPHSLGLLYSAFTQRVGLKPNSDEYILMGMAAYGSPIWADDIRREFLQAGDDFRLTTNVHAGIDNWKPTARDVDLAASIQVVLEEELVKIMRRAQEITGSDNLVYAGGVALNCLANRLLPRIFSRIWIMPCPGDAGNALGAAALLHGRLDWKDPYLGWNIDTNPNPLEAVQLLQTRGMIGLASGKTEFGPRALGNRSLLADPRGADVQSRVNTVKRRQQFRPFAPAILEEHASDWFDTWETSPYMQRVVRCRRPDAVPAVVHQDGTSRVQTVSVDCTSPLRKILEAWYAATACPILLNTSLNIKDKPMVNTREDADAFEEMYRIPVL